ncbi:hypothetical protein [Halalkalibacter alkalisediminis]|uniref:Lia operon protein LiaI n=1 Tax=Halalkalibacter alkalisediminis TaxID=935616 RepID=A0ABV6NM06_9BACI|nr:hypothetical protein [Halalkalibacter alkalisediminis]
MKQTGKVIGGILLVFIGASILLGMLGINLGGLFGLVIGGCFIYWGYSISRDKGKWSIMSILLVALGTVIFLGGIGGVVSLVIGAFLVYGGYKMLQTKETVEESEISRSVKSSSTYDNIDEEFAQLIGEGGAKNGHEKN